MITFLENNKKLEDIEPNKETKFEINVLSNVETFVKSIKVSCGCTTPELVGNPIKPETPSIMKVSFTPGGTGYHQKSIWLAYSENGEEKEAQFSFNTMIK